MSITKEPTE